MTRTHAPLAYTSGAFTWRGYGMVLQSLPTGYPRTVWLERVRQRDQETFMGFVVGWRFSREENERRSIRELGDMFVKCAVHGADLSASLRKLSKSDVAYCEWRVRLELSDGSG